MYFFTQLDIIGFVPTLIYFTYMFVFAMLFFLITGTIGFYACHLFVWVIYGAIKVSRLALSPVTLIIQSASD
jgi:transmembrane 9 superfamily protein 2/4